VPVREWCVVSPALKLCVLADGDNDLDTLTIDHLSSSTRLVIRRAPNPSSSSLGTLGLHAASHTHPPQPVLTTAAVHLSSAPPVLVPSIPPIIPMMITSLRTHRRLHCRTWWIVPLFSMPSLRAHCPDPCIYSILTRHAFPATCAPIYAAQITSMVTPSAVSGSLESDLDEQVRPLVLDVVLLLALNVTFLHPRRLLQLRTSCRHFQLFAIQERSGCQAPTPTANATAVSKIHTCHALFLAVIKIPTSQRIRDNFVDSNTWTTLFLPIDSPRNLKQRVLNVSAAVVRQ
jgi:hypothetical protein